MGWWKDANKNIFVMLLATTQVLTSTIITRAVAVVEIIHVGNV